MSRRQAYSHSELLDITKRLLLENGYDGFTLKLLSQHLPGARSTIYQYFANKDEIIAACMKRVMAGIMEKTSVLDESDPIRALRELLEIYLGEMQLHQLLSDTYKIKASRSEATRQAVEYVENAHDFLKEQLARIFQNAQQEDLLRNDVPFPVHVSVFFNLINTPNMLNLPISQWSNMLFDIWFAGAKK